MLMKRKILLLLPLLIIALSLEAQTERTYNDTSYFIPFDDDFNLIMSSSKGHANNVISLLERGADINKDVDSLNSGVVKT